MMWYSRTIRNHNSVSKCIMYLHIHDILVKIMQLKKDISQENSRFITQRNRSKRCRRNRNGLTMHGLSSFKEEEEEEGRVADER